ncbi:sulfotransferase family protein [Candidatus Sumerlaeota bacterium]|nr:sulfotransferase family protein [Candidatus Sumerlaeota bacterium]
MKYGKPVIIVSGLPRSGTSMMMKILDAGGVEVVTDGARTADEDNPKGYYEFERVKDLDKGGDKSWMREMKGKAIKVISFLLQDLPDDCFYQVIFMNREIAEILASQKKMLVRRGEPAGETRDEDMAKLYEGHLQKVIRLMRSRSNFASLEVPYREALEKPRLHAERINKFLGGGLDAERMATVGDKSLYRNRAGA